MNALAGKHGVGRLDIVEDRLVGIKSREVYEAPGAIALIAAHEELENLTIERDLGRFKRDVETEWARARLRRPLVLRAEARARRLHRQEQEHVTGDIRLRLQGGSAVVTGRRSAESLYDFSLATYDTGDTFDQSHAKGFIELWSAPEQDLRPARPRPSLTLAKPDGTVAGALWGGRFSAGPSHELAALSRSTHFDWHARPYDIAGLPGARRGARGGRLPDAADHDALQAGLDATRRARADGTLTPRAADEDVHCALEAGSLAGGRAELGGRCARAQSRNDQIATLIRLYLNDHARPIALQLIDLSTRSPGQAERPSARSCRAAPTCSTRSRCCSRTTCSRTPGRSCATSTGSRDWRRRADASPYGSGALAGSSLGLDPTSSSHASSASTGPSRTRWTAPRRATSSPSSRSSPR